MEIQYSFKANYVIIKSTCWIKQSLDKLIQKVMRVGRVWSYAFFWIFYLSFFFFWHSTCLICSSHRTILSSSTIEFLFKIVCLIIFSDPNILVNRISEFDLILNCMEWFGFQILSLFVREASIYPNYYN